MDTATNELVLELLLSDVHETLQDAGDDSDLALALEAYKVELEGGLSNVQNYRAAIHLLRADQQEQQETRDLVQRALEDEDRAATDHAMACRLAGLPPPIGAPNPQALLRNAPARQELLHERASGSGRAQVKSHAGDELLDLPGIGSLALVPNGFDFRILDQQYDESSLANYPITRKGKEIARPHVECNVCARLKPDNRTTFLRCDPEPHTYCDDCMIELFYSSMSENTLFPPRCCRVEIDINQLLHLFTVEFRQQFVDKREELSTPNPTYCSNTLCASFVKMQFHIADIARCQKCLTRTCSVCKSKAHHGELCAEDEKTKALLTIAGANKWQRCPRCNNMIELRFGCDHITCRCKMEFCYLCAAKWKTCKCPLWDEERLMMARRGEAVQALVPAPAAAPVAAPAHRRRRCGHDGGTTRIKGTGPRGRQAIQCGGCSHWIPFIIECDLCFTRACWECLRNRR